MHLIIHGLPGDWYALMVILKEKSNTLYFSKGLGNIVEQITQIKKYFSRSVERQHITSVHFSRADVDAYIYISFTCSYIYTFSFQPQR